MGRRRDERGMSVSLFVAVGVVFLIIVIGIGVDASGQVGAQQDARSVARQAARAAAQQLNFADGNTGLEQTHAQSAADAYLASSGYTGTMTLDSTGTGTVSVTVSVRSEYRTKFLSVIGITTLSVTGSGTTGALAVTDSRPR